VRDARPELDGSIDMGIEREPATRQDAAGLTEGLRFHRIAEHRDDSARERTGIACRYEQPSDPVLDDVGRSTDPCGNDGTSGCRCLDQCGRQRLCKRRKHDEIAGGEKLGKIGPVAQEDDGGPMDLRGLAELRFPLAAAGEHDFDTCRLRPDEWQRVEEHLMSLAVTQDRRYQNDPLSDPESERSSNFFTGSGSAGKIEAIQIDAVGNQVDAGCAHIGQLCEPIGGRRRRSHERIRLTGRRKRPSATNGLAPRIGWLVEDVTCERQRDGRQSADETREDPGVLTMSVHDVDAGPCEQAQILKAGMRVAQPPAPEVVPDHRGVTQLVGQLRIILT
jgi:hypothetical protein